MKKIISIIAISFFLSLCCLQAGALAEDAYFVGKDSKETLLRAKAAHPDDYVVAYYLGQIFLNEGNLDEAIEEWNRYMSLAPKDHAEYTAVRERLVVLKHRQAKDFAQKVAKQDPWTLEKYIKGNTIAILNFINRGAFKNDMLSKGFTAMIITDLSYVPQLKVIERQKMQALIEEMRLGETGIIDEATALKAGKMLMAKHVVRGEIDYPTKENLNISSAITRTIDPEDIGAPKAEGLKDEFFKLEKEIVFGILIALGYNPDELDPKLRKFHTKSFDALLSYARGLDYQDQGRFNEANEAFREALKADPDFGLAGDELTGGIGEDFAGIDEMDLDIEPMEPVEIVVDDDTKPIIEDEETPKPPEPPTF